MTKCNYCGNNTDLPFNCSYCGAKFCIDHRLPESHNCDGVLITRATKKIQLPQFRRDREIDRRVQATIIPKEYKHLLIAWFVLGFCFSVSSLYVAIGIDNYMYFIQGLIIALFTIGAGFIAHEMSHRYLAKRFGCDAEFRLWPLGLVIAVIFALITQGTIIFAAPGAVYINPHLYGGRYIISKREYGIISIAGPTANVVVALIFFIISLLNNPLLTLIGQTGFIINMWLAAFNLIPFGMMDGAKIINWNWKIWALLTIPVWILTFFRIMT